MNWDLDAKSDILQIRIIKGNEDVEYCLDLDRLEKLEKVVDILKNKFFIDLIERQDDGKLGFVPINSIENQLVFAEITKEEYELLKEVFEDEKR